MTSDGITKKDWSKIHRLAVKVVNSYAIKDEARASHSAKQVLEELDILEKKYGILPSILATRADYVIGVRARLRLLRAAFAKAVEIKDVRNQLSIASSLTEYFADRKQIKLASEWLKIGQNLLKKHFDNYEAKNLRNAAKQIFSEK